MRSRTPSIGVDPAGSEILDEFSETPPRAADIVLAELAVELDRLSPVELILDDTHELTQPQSVDILTYLLEEVRPPSQAVLLTRGDVRLPIARRRVTGGLLEIRAEDLALDADEVRELAINSGTRLSEQTLELLHERTEGWPAGIALALHTLDESASAVEVARTISGSHRDIADYLTEVILDRETEGRRRFLLATSVLTQMTAPLCDAILGVNNSNEVLAELERTNSFVIALDDHRGWYRYHHLFAELLRSELNRTDPELTRVYLSRAAAWYQREGTSPDEAFRCARESGDLKLAGTIVLAVMDDFVRQGRIETLKQWLGDCTDEEICSDPQLAIVAGWVSLHLGKAEEATRFTTCAADGDLDNGPSAEGLSSVRSSLADLRSFLAPDGIHKMLDDAEFVRAAEAGSADPHGLIDGTLAAAVANLMLGRPDTAVAALREALALTVDNPAASAVRIPCLAFIAFASAQTGDWSAARKAAREAVAAYVALGLDRTLHAGIALTARAMVLVHDGDFDRASVELANARRSSHRYRAMRWLSRRSASPLGQHQPRSGRPARRTRGRRQRTSRPARLPRPGHAPLAAGRARHAHPLARRPPPHPGRDPHPPLPAHPPLDPGDRRTPARITGNGEDTRLLGLRKTRRRHTIGSRRAHGTTRPPHRPHRRRPRTRAALAPSRSLLLHNPRVHGTGSFPADRRHGWRWTISSCGRSVDG